MIKTLYNIFLQSKGVSTDTRTLKTGQIFIALSGDNFDGNTYIEQALALGAMHAISDRTTFEKHENVTVVSNTLETLQQLATYHRDLLNLPVIGLTGSNGKTTTKELIISVLKQSCKVTGTAGNLNNHIGVPLTLLSFTKDTEIGVVEMGANHQLEIAALSKIAKPNIGLITNYGKAHMEGFGGVEGIKKGKSELFDYLRSTNGTAVVGSWDHEQLKRSEGIKRVLTTPNCSVSNGSETLHFYVNDKLVKTNLTGVYNFQNAMLAYTIGTIFNIPEELIIKGISEYTPTNHRSQLMQVGNLNLILDSYNANPSSMEVAINNLASKENQIKIAVLGDMFELGAYALEEHTKIAELTVQQGIDQVYLIGSYFNDINVMGVFKFKSFDDFATNFPLNKNQKATVLIKGSRGMALERVLKLL